MIEGRSFRRWTGTVPAGGTVSLFLPPGGAADSGRILVALVAIVALTFLLAAWRWLRPSAARASAASPDRLLDALAVLDARYAGRAAETPAGEWDRYQAERGTLKARLDAALATRTQRP
jgi:hypothetical protein